MVNDGMFAFNSTASSDVALHEMIPNGFGHWVIVSSRGCCHREHIDPAGACTVIHVLIGVKIFLLGYLRNPSATSWNPKAGHHPASVSEEVVYEVVTIEAPNYLYV